MELYIIDKGKKGRGVCCTTDIDAGQVIEICPVIICPPQDRTFIDKTALYDYYFLWGEQHKETAIALGFGSLYNHSYDPNAIYETYYEDAIIRFVARKFIPAETEITINYNHDPEDETKVWFEVER
jgi:hypothetical protein